MKTKTLYKRDAQRIDISRFSELPPHGKHIRNEKALLRQECPAGTLRQLDLQRVK